MKIVVVGHPRSGTNSLVEVLQCQPDRVMANEPFSEGYPTWADGNVDYRARMQAGTPFDTLLEEVLSSFAGLKELSYELDDDQLHRLVHHPEACVVTLRRRNILETAVSQVIAEQTGLWKTWDADGPLENHYRNVAPLDVDIVRARMSWTLNEIARVEVAVADVEHLPLVYEDVYLGSREERAALVTELWTFLGLPAITSDRIDHHLSPEVRLARPSTYGQVPNLAAIEDALGADSTGHLDPGLLQPADPT